MPKTAGQSIERVFLARMGLTWEQRAPLLLRPNRDPARGPPRLAHLYADEYVACGHVSREDFAGFFKFAVVRNPWARAVSEYKFAYRRRMEFPRFLDEVVARRQGVVEDRHIDPQRRFLAADGGPVLVDRVLRYETLAYEFAAVSRRVFGEPVPLPRTNVAPDQTDYRAFFDDTGRRLIAEIYRDDIETFGYRFDQ